MSDQEECKCPPEGLPAYMGTFADLMALLMCFFVLLLSFSEMDVLKFKQIAGSMKFAFGVQHKVEVKDIPKGTSIIAQEFSPGKPQPTIIEAVMQQTVDITKETLDFAEPTEKEPDEGFGDQNIKGKGDKPDTSSDETDESAEITETVQVEVTQEQIEAQKQAEQLAKEIASELHEEILEGQIELLAKQSYVVIRIRERGSFSSGSDTIEDEFLPVLQKIKGILVDTTGEIRVAGHTDNVPINTEYFRSNWELSGGRAGSVTRELLSDGQLDRNRFVITGYADTKPIADNDTSDGRAANRRVEIIIVKGDQSINDVVGVGVDS
ncbi:MAG: flagellar motor protein MotB [Gammaproteobacteria bacterium]|nr:flagellar motor protein MotB [Gammaproteobacteria bacterium]MDH5629948.1 flagellar motor protein MotB [Gammaproteobacteria bacterium]